MSESNPKTKIEYTVTEIKSSLSNVKQKKKKDNLRSKFFSNSLTVSKLNINSDCSKENINFFCKLLAENESVIPILTKKNRRKRKKSLTKPKVNPAQNAYKTQSQGKGDREKYFPTKLEQKNPNITQCTNNAFLPHKQTASGKDCNDAKKENQKEMAAKTKGINIPQSKPKEYFKSGQDSRSSVEPIMECTDCVFSHLMSNLEEYSCLKSSKNNLINTKNSYHRVYSSMSALLKAKNNLSESVQNETKCDLLGKKIAKENNTVKIRNLGSEEVPKKCTQNSITSNELEKAPVNSNLQLNKDPNKASTLTSNSTKIKKHEEHSKPSINEFPKLLSTHELALLERFGVLMSGVIRINPKNYKEAYIAAPDKGKDICIKGLKDRNRALEGDEVFVLLKLIAESKTDENSTDTERTGVVVGMKVLKHSRKAIGTLTPIKHEGAQFTQFCPRDIRVPKITIRKNNWPEGFLDSQSFKSKLYLAKISGWNDLRFAEG